MSTSLTTPGRTSSAGPSLVRARAAVTAAFVMSGILVGSWVVNFPRLEIATGISHGVLGTILIIPAAACIVGVQVCGALSDRIGSRPTLLAGAALAAVSVAVAARATNAWELAVPLLFFGFGLGALDVSMNAQSVVIERLYGRRILASFHAFYSMAAAFGGIAAGVLIGLGWTLESTVAVCAVSGCTLIAATASGLLPKEYARPQAEPTQSGADAALQSDRRNRWTPAILALGLSALLLMLCEGAANDWSAVQVHERFGVTGGAAAGGYAAFAVAMTVGRLGGDRIAMRLGPVRVIRYGTLVAAAAVALIIVSSALWLTVAAWALFGLGLSGCVPILFSAAGNQPTGTAGVALGRVSGMGYVGLLSGPTLIGWTAQATSIAAAFGILVVACVGSALLAGSVRTRANCHRELPSKS
ncbi:MFS transporter [Diaminobutyricibacter sp. McL0618]|uniref:MFS transporter n=1 Tax=Leifsonia sp. McL0618 TaxID=3415677 RepID=UPI003CEC3786